MMGEYGALTGGEFVTTIVEFLGDMVDFMMTPKGLIIVGIAFILLIFFARKR